MTGSMIGDPDAARHPDSQLRDELLAVLPNEGAPFPRNNVLDRLIPVVKKYGAAQEAYGYRRGVKETRADLRRLIEDLLDEALS